MNIQDAAKALDGCQYRSEGSAISFAGMKEAGLVAVYGASDDLIEFSGAIHDEAGCYEGGEVFVNGEGLVEYPDCDCDAAKKLHRIETENAFPIKAIWSPEGMDCSWAYETEITHAKFNVFEDDDLYCVGFVFAINDLKEMANT